MTDRTWRDASAGTGLLDAPTAPLPAPAAATLARLESAFPAVLAEQHRTERAATALRNGESAVINGTPVTAVSLETAEAVARYEAAARHVTEITAALADPDYKPTGLEWDDLAHVEDVMAGARAVLAEAGMLNLIGGGS